MLKSEEGVPVSKKPKDIFALFIFLIFLYCAFYAYFSDSFTAVKKYIYNDASILEKCGKIRFIYSFNNRFYKDEVDGIYKNFYSVHIFCSRKNLQINFSTYKNNQNQYIVEKNNP